jgi:hypothetical protein
MFVGTRGAEAFMVVISLYFAMDAARMNFV